MRTAPAANLRLPVRRGRTEGKAEHGKVLTPTTADTGKERNVLSSSPPSTSPGPPSELHTLSSPRMQRTRVNLEVPLCSSMEQTCQSVSCITTQHHLKASSMRQAACTAPLQGPLWWPRSRPGRSASRLALGAPLFLSSAPAKGRDLLLAPQSQHSGMCLP